MKQDTVKDMSVPVPKAITNGFNEEQNFRPIYYPIDCVDSKCRYCTDDQPRHRTCTLMYEGFGSPSYDYDRFWFYIMLILFVVVVLYCSKGKLY